MFHLFTQLFQKHMIKYQRIKNKTIQMLEIHLMAPTEISGTQ